MFNNIFKNKTVLVTGHTGFKGGWLSSWLNILGANVHGLSLKPLTEPNFFDSTGLENLINSNIIDIRDELLVKELINDIKPDFIFHMATNL